MTLPPHGLPEGEECPEPESKPENTAPSKPSWVVAPTTVRLGKEYGYSFAATDADGNALRYVVDWGDGTNTETGYFSSGATAWADHAWADAPTGPVTVIAYDFFHAASSPLSDDVEATGPPVLADSTVAANVYLSNGHAVRGLDVTANLVLEDPEGDAWCVLIGVMVIRRRRRRCRLPKRFHGCLAMIILCGRMRAAER